MTDEESAPSAEHIEVDAWKVRCYSCGWLPTVGSKPKAERMRRRHKRECGTKAEVKAVTAYAEGLWSDTLAADVIEEVR